MSACSHRSLENTSQIYLSQLIALKWLPNDDSLLCQRRRASVLREIHVLWAGEGLQGPVEETVEEDEAGTAGPNQQDGDEGSTQVIDHLQYRSKYIIMENQ